MQRVLDWIDESASSLIRLAYLFAGITAVAAYFGAGNLPPGAVTFSNAILPYVLAGAIETHTYLSARRVRGHWQQMQATTEGTAEFEQAKRGLVVNLVILTGLLLFSMYNQLEYLALTWRPTETALTLPGPLAYAVRAIVAPAAFMAAAFLAPMGENLTSQVRAVAHHVTRQAFSVAKKQWKDRLDEMKRNKEDVTAALVQLVEDPQERKMVETIHRAMHGGKPADVNDVPYFQEAGTNGWHRLPEPQPPTNGGTPGAGFAPLAPSETVANGKVVRIPAHVRRPRSARSANGRQTRRVKTPTDPLAVERAARAAYQPGMSVGELQDAAGISRAAASKHRRILRTENGEKSSFEQERELIAQ